MANSKLKKSTAEIRDLQGKSWHQLLVPLVITLLTDNPNSKQTLNNPIQRSVGSAMKLPFPCGELHQYGVE